MQKKNIWISWLKSQTDRAQIRDINEILLYMVANNSIIIVEIDATLELHMIVNKNKTKIWLATFTMYIHWGIKKRKRTKKYGNGERKITSWKKKKTKKKQSHKKRIDHSNTFICMWCIRESNDYVLIPVTRCSHYFFFFFLTTNFAPTSLTHILRRVVMMSLRTCSFVPRERRPPEEVSKF